MALGSGINPDKFNWLVHNVNPTQLHQAVNQMASGSSDLGAGGAMDMSGSAASPSGAQPQAGMDWASVFGNAPNAGAGAPMNPQMMQQLMGAMQPQGGGAPRAPAVAPSKPGMITFPSANIPRGLAPVPQLKDLLGGV